MDGGADVGAVGAGRDRNLEMDMRPKDMRALSQRDGAMSDLAEVWSWLRPRRWMVITALGALVALASPLIVLSILALMLGDKL